MPFEAIAALVGKSDPALDLQMDIIVDHKVGAKINKFLNWIESIIVGHNLGFSTSQVQQHRLRFASFTDKSTLIDFHLPIETIVAPVGKTDPTLDFQTDIIVGDKGGAKINYFLD